MSTAPGRSRALLAVFGLIGCAILALCLPLAAEAQAKKKKKPAVVEVMTRNVFLGADLRPAIDAQTPQDFVAANGAILREVDQTDFPRRSRALAAEIRRKRPDLVGLQELALWRTAPPSFTPAIDPNVGPQATDVKYDFLELLLDKINRRKRLYRVAVVQEEFDFEAPADYDNNPATGASTLGGEINGRLTMRDVILVRRSKQLKIRRPRGGHFENLLEVTVGGAVTVPVTRGWTALDAKVRKGKGRRSVKRSFRFVNTHLEAFDDRTLTPSIRQLQAEELVAPGGPAMGRKPVILVGDLNSDDDTVVPDDQKAYRALLAAGLRERSTDNPLSCCVSDLFNSPRSEFDHQVDHVMTDTPRRVKLLNSSVTGLRKVGGLYPSDHAGVFSKLRLK